MRKTSVQSGTRREENDPRERWLILGGIESISQGRRSLGGVLKPQKACIRHGVGTPGNVHQGEKRQAGREGREAGRRAFRILHL